MKDPVRDRCRPNESGVTKEELIGNEEEIDGR